MKNITQQDLLDLNFKKIHVSAEESGDKPFNYFIFGKNGRCLLLSSCDDEGEYFEIEFSDIDGYRIKCLDILKKQIEIFNLIS